jgi:hypothetical protein
MLDDVPAGTSRAGDFFGLHDSRINLPETTSLDAALDLKLPLSYIVPASKQGLASSPPG